MSLSLERLNLYNPVQEQLNVLRDMQRYHQEMEDADTVASFNVQFADSLEVVESEDVQFVQNIRKSGKSRYDKKAMRRKGSPKRFRDRSRKCAHEGHIWKTYHRGLSGDCNIRGRRLEKTGRPQSVNVHFTDGFRHDTFGMSEEDIDQTWSVDSWDYPNTDMFIEAMESWDWKRIPSEVRFQVWWNAENPMANPEDSSPDCFWMKATGNQGGKTVNAEKAHEEFLRFKKEYQIYQKYAKRIGELHRMERDLYRQMREELRSV